MRKLLNKYTPGPWIVDGNGFSNSWNVSGEFSICNVAHYPDARLIAAAPDMYEALVALLTSTDLNLDEGIDETTIEAMRLGWDAVRKAGGK